MRWAAQTAAKTMGYGYVARIGAGVNPEQMHANVSTVITRWP
jgi:hypothetical protein